ncbi:MULTISPECIES: radical SAM family heme chaperone HemW [Lysinibacillus]|jgi:oxygen-independent coproporphyrinogen-3 oxidase|uniref:radical SAM family heme chaperone HemW n=1 Tax=Lysinibacillus TaxID=400634 RepID=UPI0004D6BB13|nr:MULTISPECIES: radical SAM family heme chaperone HemW [Lysinibacillus]AJK87082.1 coproporphyrinogen III oxidase [Lysinibacillus fusiformis]KAB0443476.1 coproporphyrinogen III oxidase [Lysinibacillus fusiformis]KGA81226.1 coproporphyrinogen III oxidase [Lysinibacillus fusiformis]KHK55145.1 coproporphyrinogen III oxidase [Lysinibacillus sp. A1]MCK1988670.1 radical SAM family heme chaperone HemW [Lysinibacillus fusiformis]
MARGVYIHIPFCHQICNYCDFNKFYFKNQPVDEYIEALGKEMALATQKNPESFRHIETIFLGGGTPTALSPQQLDKLLTLIRTYIPMNSVTEFTSEANPDELSAEKLQVLFEGGVNRLSMGVQSFDQGLLQKIGRTHSNEHVYETIALAKKIGFQNISIDLMYGLPGQTMAQWKDSLEKALALDLPHFSAYSLIVEPKTIFYNQYAKGKLLLPTEDLEADMYDVLMQQMELHGLQQYEISNFAKPGYHSEHNKIYWDNDEYAGFGAGAHGYLAGVRYSNHGPLKKYMETVFAGELPIVHEHEVSQAEKREEQMFLGLRKTEGVKHKIYEEKLKVPIVAHYDSVLKELVSKGLLEHDDVGVRLTRKGRFVGNEVFQQFLLEE